MRDWAFEQKVAATLVLILLGLGMLAGAANVALTVGTSPEEIKKRYAAPSDDASSDPMAILEEPPVTLGKLAHVIHVHLIPYTFVFALAAFFLLQLTYSPHIKPPILVLLALAIAGDFMSMLATRFVAPVFHLGIALSGFLFMSIVGGIILLSLYELWFVRRGVKP